MTLSYLPRNISPELDSASNIVIQALISLVVLIIVFCSALLGGNIKGRVLTLDILT
jgi:hypothetical protein